ncbi:hypothetical protein Tco_0467854 [Tanacetum coccineum]
MQPTPFTKCGEGIFIPKALGLSKRVGLWISLSSLSAGAALPHGIDNLISRGNLGYVYALRSVESKCKGGVPDDGASGLVWESMMGGGNGK